MQICEIQSKQMNKVLEPRKVEQIISQVENGLRIKNIQDAKQLINDLISIIKSKDNEIDNFQITISEKQKYIDTYD